MKSFAKLLILFSFFAPIAQAQDLSKLSPSLSGFRPVNIFPADADRNYIFKGRSDSTNPGKFSIIKEGTLSIFQAEAPVAFPSHYDIQTSWKNIANIKKGDVLLARFLIRSIYAKQESGDAVVNFYVQQALPPNEKSIILTVGAGPEWKEFNVPFIAAKDMAAGEAAICFSFGAIAQKVQISKIELLNYGTDLKLSQLPETRFTYNGREKDAPWRIAAMKQIERIRKAPLKINVTDGKGNPLSGATVEIKQVKSDFLFGTAVSADLLCRDGGNTKKYREELKSLFNTVTIDNGLKWPSWANPKSRECTKSAIQWINNSGFDLRGHNLVWPARKFSPEIYKTRKDFGPGFADSIENHIKDIVSYTKDKVIAWDVINEMAHEKEYFNVMPRKTAAEWFKLARSIDPKAQLFINEYGMLNSISSPAMIKIYLELIAELKSYGAPIDAMGVQGHVGRQPRDPSAVISDLNLLAKAGIPIQITEFDINTTDETLQADYTRDFLIACYSHPSVTGFTMWGFWESAHWKPDAAMFRKDWTEKPNAEAWRNLVTKEWMTNVIKKTGADGKFETSGFLGVYDITITAKNGNKTKYRYHLKKTSEPLRIRLK